MQAPLDSAQNTIQSIGKQISDVKLPELSTQGIRDGATQGLASLSSNIDATKSSINDTIGQFSSENAVSASKEFLESNSIIAKFVFVIFVVIVFLFLMSLGISIISYFLQSSRSPYLVSGMVSGNANIVIPQDPNNPDSIIVYRSNDQTKGLEATWSVWLLINDLGTTPKDSTSSPVKYVSYKHIFSKGDSEFKKYDSNENILTRNDRIGVTKTNNAPGVYIADGTSNTLRIYMDDVKDNNTPIDIDNIPLKKWFHLVIRIQNNIMDIYINGIISGRKNFDNTPKQNYDDVIVGSNSGFQGNLSDLVYYDHALGVFDINNILIKGPNLKQSSSEKGTSTGYYTYLSNSWYSAKM
jgi:hypothetical protein